MTLSETLEWNITDRVRAAIKNTKRVALKHWEETLEQRSNLSLLGRKRGSFYELNAYGIETELLKAAWYEYAHDKILPVCFGATARIPGRLGIIALAELSPNTRFVTIAAHDSRPGFCELLLDGPAVPQQGVEFTTLILGPGDGPEREEVVWTFHPGDPIDPTETFTTLNQLEVGQGLTRDEAVALGFLYAKMV